MTRLDTTTGGDWGTPGETGVRILDIDHRPPTAAEIQHMIWKGDVRLADGDGTRSPVWHALLHPDAAGVVDARDSQAARSQFDQLVNANPYVVWACMDKTGDQARVILEEALSAPAMD